jgi:hypothetical protein
VWIRYRLIVLILVFLLTSKYFVTSLQINLLLGTLIDLSLQYFSRLFNSVLRLLQKPVPLYNIILAILCFTFFTVYFFMIIITVIPTRVPSYNGAECD